MSEFSTTYSQPISATGIETIWEQSSEPFNELIVSWNALRPVYGTFLLSVSVYCKYWSEWLPYVEWGADGQKTFQSNGAFARTYQDIIQIADRKTADAFRVKITASGQNDLGRFDALHGCASHFARFVIKPVPDCLEKVCLLLPSLRSQMVLSHPRHRDLCSPTSISMAIDYLLGKRASDPIELACKVRDNYFDIYGNWILNVAESYAHLQRSYHCRVQRLPSFEAIHRLLMQQLPVVVSVQGPLANAPSSFSNGHLILISGWDPEERKVLCADPAHLTDAQVLTSYAIDDFLAAWARRRNLSYVFLPKSRNAQFLTACGIPQKSINNFPF